MHALARGASLFGPSYLRLLSAARSGDRRRLHIEERRWATQATRALELTIELHGIRHIDPAEQYVVASLHEGFADVLALIRLPLDLAYSATEELFEWRFLGRYLTDSAQSSLSISNGASAYREMLGAVRTAAARGESYVVFPQGSILGIEVAFHQGAFRLAAASGLPLLPIVLTGGATVWEHPFSPTLNFGQTIRLEVLKPINAVDILACAPSVEAEMKARALAAHPRPRNFVPERDGWWDGYPYEIDPNFPDLAERVARHRQSTSDAVPTRVTSSISLGGNVDTRHHPRSRSRLGILRTKVPR